MSDTKFIEFVAVQKSYDGEHLVIPDLSFTIRKGEFLTLLGASGSGKTTTLMMLAGFEIPTAGEIRMNGAPIQDVPAHKRGIGMVFQNYALFPHMNVQENLAYPLKTRGMPKPEVERRVRHAMEMVRLPGMSQRKPAELSGGQQQRVALARALVFEPELVLMDEPLGALDKNLREHMQYEIKQLHKDLGVTVVYVTHDQAEALTMSDRVAVFLEGRIAQMAPPAEIYDRPVDSYVATFVGENNSFNGRVAVNPHGGWMLDLGDAGTLPLLGSTIAGPPLAGGQAVCATLRPERIRIERAKAAHEGVPLSCKVSDLVYLGDHTRLVCELPNRQTVVAKLAGGVQVAQMAIGSTVALCWEPGALLVFPIGG